MGVEDVIEETDEWKVVKNGNGASLKWWKHRSGTPEHIAFDMSSRKIWERDFRPHLPGASRKRMTQEKIDDTADALAKHRAGERWTHYGHQFIWENMAIDPMEVKAGNDPLRIARKYRDKLALIGGLDVRILESGDRDYISRQVIRLVEGMKAAEARYIYMSDHSVSSNVDYDDFRFALDVYRDHMYY